MVATIGNRHPLFEQETNADILADSETGTIKLAAGAGQENYQSRGIFLKLMGNLSRPIRCASFKSRGAKRVPIVLKAPAPIAAIRPPNMSPNP
jgi:hypothetical protein